MKPERRRPARRVYRVPPPLTRARGQTGLPASEIAAEFPDDTGALLWKSYRTVDLWAMPGPGHALFADGALAMRQETITAAGLDPALRAPLEVIAGLLGNPRVVEASRVAGACREVARWAEERGKLGTALAFAQAGALADPENALAAVLVGRLARIRAEYDRAESWFDHALMLARQGRDRQAHAEALAGMGNLYVQKGNFPKARELHMRCLRAAKRYTLREMQGAALHNLFAVEVECDSWAEADRFVEEALDAYPAGSPGLLRLAQDVAYHWVAQGRHAPALLVMEELLTVFQCPAVRLVILGHVARAAAGLGNCDIFERAWSQVWAGLSEDDVPGSARALLGLAHGAASLQEWSRAERALSRAISLATLRGEGNVRDEAERVKEMIRSRVSATTGGDLPAARAVEHLATRFVAALRESRAGAMTA